MGTLPGRTRPELAVFGTQAAQPTAGRVECRLGYWDGKSQRGRLDFTFVGARIVVTDGAGSGSHGSLPLFTFIQSAISFLGTRQDYTAFAEGAALTTGVGDAAFEIGIGTTAIAAAAAGTLGDGVNENVGQAVAVTNSEGTGAGTAVDGAKTTALNGTASAIGLHLNWSGSAATIDDDSTIDVWGTASVEFALLGDD